MITVSLTTEELMEFLPCKEGLALWREMAPEGSLSVPWTMLHDIWIRCAYPEFAGWLTDMRIIPRCHLQGADLRGADLRGANLQGADLRGAYLQGADLRNAYLRGADLQGADLRGAYLQGADLQGADLRDANLRNADLRDANLRNANLRGADLRGADLRGWERGPDGFARKEDA